MGWEKEWRLGPEMAGAGGGTEDFPHSMHLPRTRGRTPPPHEIGNEEPGFQAQGRRAKEILRKKILVGTRRDRARLLTRWGARIACTG